LVKFKVIVLGRGDEIKLERCLKSLENQTYSNYDVCIIDDATYPKKMREQGVQAGNREAYQSVAMKYCNKYSNWILKVNDERKYGALNHLQAISLLNCRDEDVIVDLDADDYLFSNYSLEIVNDYYEQNSNNLTPYNQIETEVWLTFGSHILLSNHMVYPNIEIHQQYVKYKEMYNHIIDDLKYSPPFNIDKNHPGNYALRTYKYFLWKNISSKDFMIDDKLIHRGEDKIYMKAMMEMAGCNWVSIPQLLYVYDDINVKKYELDDWYAKLGFETQKDIKVFKRKLKLKLVEDWKQFPLIHNGG